MNSVRTVSFTIWTKRRSGESFIFPADHGCGYSTRRTNLGPEIDIADLTWEQKEQVLRSLFIQMNTRQSGTREPTMEG